jgi:phage baseplate assembly protein W
MAIVINNLTRTKTYTQKDITYKDIWFDLQEDALPTTNTAFGDITRSDIRVSSDEGAILNSIKNIFTTVPGQKVLNPSFGVNLVQWLFEPCSDFNAREIGEAVVNGIERFEPRVVVNGVTVLQDPDRNEYQIKLALLMPQLNINKEYRGVLSSPGFDFITENE